MTTIMKKGITRESVKEILAGFEDIVYLKIETLDGNMTSIRIQDYPNIEVEYWETLLSINSINPYFHIIVNYNKIGNIVVVR